MQFIKFHIFTNDLDPKLIKDKLSDDFEVYYKIDHDDLEVRSLNYNRLTLFTEANNKVDVNDFLYKNLIKIKDDLVNITYIKNEVKFFMELIIYIDEVTSIFHTNINKDNLKLMALLDVDFAITFIYFKNKLLDKDC